MTVAYRLEVKLDGTTVFLKRVATAKTSISDFRPLWKEIVKWFLQMEALQFATEGLGKWPALAPSTVRKRGSAHPILVVTGGLQRSLTNAGVGWYHVETPMSVELGSTLTVKGGWNLGLLHQRGTGRAVSHTGKKGKPVKKASVSFRMPPRPPIDPNWKQRSALRYLYSNYIHRVITGENIGGGMQSV